MFVLKSKDKETPRRVPMHLLGSRPRDMFTKVAALSEKRVGVNLRVGRTAACSSGSQENARRAHCGIVICLLSCIALDRQLSHREQTTRLSRRGKQSRSLPM